jgi:hypothetical protein
MAVEHLSSRNIEIREISSQISTRSSAGSFEFMGQGGALGTERDNRRRALAQD